MLRKALILSVIFIVSLNGCATAPKPKDLEIQGLRNQIQVLEAQLQSKDEEINSLRETLAKATEEKEAKVIQASKKKVIGEVKSRPTTRHIQIALKNAGFEPGPIDGRMGRQTRDTIKAFQKANNLVVDGKVGKQTWALLKGYLYKKIK